MNFGRALHEDAIGLRSHHLILLLKAVSSFLELVGRQQCGRETSWFIW